MAAPGRVLGVHISAGRELCRKAVAAGVRSAATVYTFNTAGLELLERAREAGLKTISDQTIAPKRVEERLLQAERERWPEWAPEEKQDPALAAYIEREETEWRFSDLIVCGSTFVKEGINECGGPVSRCVIVPTGVSLPWLPFVKRARRKGPMRVLTVGAVGLRKGSPYVFKAAEALRGTCVFRMVGQVEAPRRAWAGAPSNLELFGAVARSEMEEHYRWADTFFLPSVCEGSAISCDEALSLGLPVVCTFNAGSVVTDAVNGCLLPAGDLNGFIEKLAALAGSEAQWSALSQGALAVADKLSSEYSQRLVGVIRSLFD